MKKEFAAAIQLAEVVIVKRDFDLLKKLSLTLPPELQLQLIPYTSLFCHEAITYLERKGYTNLIQPTGRYSIQDIRQKAKFFDMSIAKLLKSIDNIDIEQNQQFIEAMKYSELGNWNVHNNLGIFYTREKKVVGNSHYAYYLFQDEKSVSSEQRTSGQPVISEEDIKSFAYDLGGIIGAISSSLEQVSDFIVAETLFQGIDIYSQDFNTNRCISPGREHTKIIRLFLLHVLTSIGYILNVLRETIVNDTGFLLRIEYITYHYTMVRLEKMLKYCKSNGAIFENTRLPQMLSEFDFRNMSGLRNSDFRNCMMHFGLRHNSDRFFISEKSFNLSVPFCGLVETCFEFDFEEYKTKVEEQLAFIYSILEVYLGISELLSTGD